jgi:hypothetical protein
MAPRRCLPPWRWPPAGSPTPASRATAMASSWPSSSSSPRRTRAGSCTSWWTTMRPRGTRRAPGRWPQRRCSWCSCGQPRPRAARQALLGRPRPGHHLGIKALLAAAELRADPGVVLVGPGRLDQLPAQVRVAGLGEPATVDSVATGMLAWDQAAEPHEGVGGREPAPVGHLGGQGERAQPGHAPVGGQPGRPASQTAAARTSRQGRPPPHPAGRCGPPPPPGSARTSGSRPGGRTAGSAATPGGRGSRSTRPAMDDRGATRTCPAAAAPG